MRIEPIKLCWLDLGEGKVCERLAGHLPPCTPDRHVDFPVEARMNAVQLAQSFLMDVAAGMVIDDEMRQRARGLAIELELFAYPNGPRMEFAVRAPVPTFTCPHCERSTTNAEDIANRYCGHCHHFCDDIDANRA